LWQVGESKTFGLWKDKAGAIIKWVAGERGKAGVPHQVREKGSVYRHRSPALVSWSNSMRSYDSIIIDADRD
jgi:hypothetical protein